MLTVNTQIDLPFQAQVEIGPLIAIIKDTLRLCQVDQAELTVAITTDETVQALNRNYRGVDASTDVLAFEAQPEQDGFILPEEKTPYLGDVIISLPTAARQALAAGHRSMDEVLLLAVHGTLHLLGHDHLTQAEKADMWRLQEAVLQSHNLSHVKPTE